MDGGSEIGWRGRAHYSECMQVVYSRRISVDGGGLSRCRCGGRAAGGQWPEGRVGTEMTGFVGLLARRMMSRKLYDEDGGGLETEDSGDKGQAQGERRERGCTPQDPDITGMGTKWMVVQRANADRIAGWLNG